MKAYLDKKAKKLEAEKKKQKPEYKNNPAFGDPSHHSNKKMSEHHQKDENGNTIPHEDELNEADKKGKGSGEKDACYKKVKASAKVWPSAYASGRLVQCRKKGAANYGNKSEEAIWEEIGSLLEELGFEGDIDITLSDSNEIVEEIEFQECWKTHKKVGMKMKGGKLVNDCRPKNEEVEQVDEKNKYDDSFIEGETGSKRARRDTTAAMNRSGMGYAKVGRAQKERQERHKADRGKKTKGTKAGHSGSAYPQRSHTIDTMYPHKKTARLKAKAAAMKKEDYGYAEIYPDNKVQIDEISADLALKASKKAEVERGKAAVAGNKERAIEKMKQSSRLYAKQAKKRRMEAK